MPTTLVSITRTNGVRTNHTRYVPTRKYADARNYARAVFVKACGEKNIRGSCTFLITVRTSNNTLRTYRAKKVKGRVNIHVVQDKKAGTAKKNTKKKATKKKNTKKKAGTAKKKGTKKKAKKENNTKKKATKKKNTNKKAGTAKKKGTKKNTKKKAGTTKKKGIKKNTNKKNTNKKAISKKKGTKKKNTKKKAISKKKGTKKNTNKKNTKKKDTKKKVVTKKKNTKQKKVVPTSKALQSTITKKFGKEATTVLSDGWQFRKRLGIGKYGEVYQIGNTQGDIRVVKFMLIDKLYQGEYEALMQLQFYSAGIAPKVHSTTTWKRGKRHVFVIVMDRVDDTYHDFLKQERSEEELAAMRSSVSQMLDRMCRVKFRHNDFHWGNIGIVTMLIGDRLQSVPTLLDFGFSSVQEKTCDKGGRTVPPGAHHGPRFHEKLR